MSHNGAPERKFVKFVTISRPKMLYNKIKEKIGGACNGNQGT